MSSAKAAPVVVAMPGEAIAAAGESFVMYEWSHGPGGGPARHIHHHDDEAWYVLEGTLRFEFEDRTLDVSAGGGVFVPAGISHTFGNPGPGNVRYLIIATARIMDLIDALHALNDRTPGAVAETYRKFDAELVV
jgi:mannose-6-phosphate isomerase-like protein (cupin superfamily)